MLLFSIAYKAISLHQSISKLNTTHSSRTSPGTSFGFSELSDKKGRDRISLDQCQEARSDGKKVAKNGGSCEEEAHAHPSERDRGIVIVQHIVYSADGRRFEVPLEYLGTMVFSELLSMSQEFGFAGDDGKITLPCDAAVMEYVMCLLRREASEEVERAFLSSMAMPCHYGNSLTQPMELAVTSF